MFISVLYTFRAAMCPSSGELSYQCDTCFVSLCVCRSICSCIHRLSSTQSDTKQVSHWYNNSPDDGRMAARNMYRIEINIHEKLCVKLVIYKVYQHVHNSPPLLPVLSQTNLATLPHTTVSSKKMDGIWNRYNLKSIRRIYTLNLRTRNCK